MTVGIAQLCRLGTIAVSSGKWYWEVVFTAATSFDGMVGVGLFNANTDQYVGGNSTTWGYYYTGQTYFSATPATYGNSWTLNDVIGVALDMDNGAVYFSKNGVFQNSGVPTSGASKTGAAFTAYSGLTIAPAFNGFGGTQVVNHGQRPFAYTAPSGYKALCTQNLPTPTIGATSNSLAPQFLTLKLYTGNGSAGNAQSGLGFQPDFLWFKSRNAARSHGLFNAVMTRTFGLASESTTSEYTSIAGRDLASFDSDGFTVGVPENFGSTNTSGDSIVAWAWKAGNNAGASNSAGTITSTVSANTRSGFSIVTYTGTSANATVGHGLGVAPAMYITKKRNSTSDWAVYHQSIVGSPSYVLQLQATDAAINVAVWWNSTNPTSSVFSLGNSSTVNGSGDSYVAYCFAEVAGYSKFGIYTGNGSTDGRFVYTGMRPAFVMIKRTDDVGEWVMKDTTRSPYNADGLTLLANRSDAEYGSGNTEIDELSNGFKLRTTSASANASGGTYVYMAFASSPFKYSLAR
jgi:hypothetical protein